MCARKNNNVSWCDGWDYERHPTNRRLVGVEAWIGTEDQTTLRLCPGCLEAFNRDKKGPTPNDQARVH